jgi:transposase-like protein
MAYNDMFHKKEYEDARIATIASGKNSFGSLTIMPCPKCGLSNKCGLEPHLCMCEHFTCSGCGEEWASEPAR